MSKAIKGKTVQSLEITLEKTLKKSQELWMSRDSTLCASPRVGQHVPWLLVKDMRLLGLRQRTLLLAAQQVAGALGLHRLLWSQFPQGRYERAHVDVTHSMLLPAEEPWPWETPISSAGKEACLTFDLEGGSALYEAKNDLLFTQRETPWLTTKAICYTNILEKTVSASACKTCRNLRHPQRTVSHQWLREKFWGHWETGYKTDPMVRSWEMGIHAAHDSSTDIRLAKYTHKCAQGFSLSVLKFL